VALMNRGRLLALDRPAALRASLRLPTLEEVFVALVERAGGAVAG
jgi:hypothetical protein